MRGREVRAPTSAGSLPDSGERGTALELLRRRLNTQGRVFGGARTMSKRGVKEPAGSVPSSVLLVEDDAIIAMDTEEALKGMGVGLVITASNVSQALAAIEQHSPAFALLDVNLGGETGFAIAEQLVGLKIPFAFATGYGEEVVVPAMFADAPKIGKPYNVDMLRAMLELAEF